MVETDPNAIKSLPPWQNHPDTPGMEPDPLFTGDERFEPEELDADGATGDTETIDRNAPKATKGGVTPSERDGGGFQFADEADESPAKSNADAKPIKAASERPTETAPADDPFDPAANKFDDDEPPARTNAQQSALIRVKLPNGQIAETTQEELDAYIAETWDDHLAKRGSGGTKNPPNGGDSPANDALETEADVVGAVSEIRQSLRTLKQDLKRDIDSLKGESSRMQVAARSADLVEESNKTIAAVLGGFKFLKTDDGMVLRDELAEKMADKVKAAVRDGRKFTQQEVKAVLKGMVQAQYEIEAGKARRRAASREKTLGETRTTKGGSEPTRSGAQRQQNKAESVFTRRPDVWGMGGDELVTAGKRIGLFK